MAAVLFGETLSGAAVAGLLVGVAGLALLNVPGGSLQEVTGAFEESRGRGRGVCMGRPCG
jgi:drug/metabolite transporter (DMT)-like permease